MKATILVIDDDDELNRLLTSYLTQFDFRVLTATQPATGLRLLETEHPDLLVLDVMLPGRTGFELCRDIRQHSRIPIIMLTARGDLSDRIVGLELGADDYLPKPYDPRELVARIQAILRRTRTTQGASVLRSGDLVLDLAKASAALGTCDLELTTAEFAVLCLLMENSGRTLTRDDILMSLRGTQWDSVDRTVDMVISRLRHKLGDEAKSSKYLKTMWGEGYRFVGEVSDG